MNGFGSSPSGNATWVGSISRTITWSTSSDPAFGHRNGKGSSAGAGRPHPAQTTVVTGPPVMSPPPSSSSPSSRGLHPRPGVERTDGLVPHGQVLAEPAPERLVLANHEVLDGHALLLDPREVAEVEDPLAILVGELKR